MKNRYASLLIAIVTIASLVLTACTPTPSGPAPKPTRPPVKPEPPYSGPKEITAGDCSYGGEIQTMSAPDNHTVKFTLCYPDPAFLDKVAFSAFGIQHWAWLDQNKGGGDMLKTPLGTGPYMVKEWVAGDHITFVANPYYWGDPPKVSTVIFRWNKEAPARLLALQAGEVDGIDNPAPNDFATISGDTKLKLYPRPPLNVFYLGLNNTKPPLDNEKVRQAIAMAINKAAIVKDYYPPGSIVATQFDPPGIQPGYTKDFQDAKFDVAAAKQMLADAGFKDGFDVTLNYRDVVRGYLPQPGKVAEEIQSQLAQIGVRVTIGVMESGAFLDAASKGELSMFMLGWGADFPDAVNFLDYHFGKGANDSFGTKWPDITGPLDQASRMSDAAARQAIYDQVNALLKQHVPMIPIAHGGNATAFKADVTGAQASPLSNEIFAVMQPGSRTQIVWMQNAEPNSLYCGDETDGETLRACEQVFDPLMGYEVNGTKVVPGLATACTGNADATQWTCTLRTDAYFSDGTPATAYDVLATFNAQWDAASPNHTGRSGTFDYWSGLFGAFMNAKK